VGAQHIAQCLLDPYMPYLRMVKTRREIALVYGCLLWRGNANEFTYGLDQIRGGHYEDILAMLQLI
jgi:hypothetical protein